jgi:hypothetical protein
MAMAFGMVSELLSVTNFRKLGRAILTFSAMMTNRKSGRKG